VKCSAWGIFVRATPAQRSVLAVLTARSEVPLQCTEESLEIAA